MTIPAEPAPAEPAPAEPAPAEPAPAEPAAPRVPLPVRCLLTVVALFVAILLPAFAGAAVVGGEPPLPLFALLAVLSCALAVALAVALARFVDRRPPRRLRLGLDLRTPLWVLAGMGVVAVAVAAAALAAGPIGAVTAGPSGWASAMLAEIPRMLVIAFLAQGIPEEVLFRGYLVRTSGDRLPVWGVLVLSSVLFGSLHILSRSDASTLAQKLLFVVMAIGIGALATAARLVAGSVWAAVGVHGGYHMANFLLSPWAVAVPAAYGSYLLLQAAALMTAAAAIIVVAVRSGRLAWREPLPQEEGRPGAVPAPGPAR